MLDFLTGWFPGFLPRTRKQISASTAQTVHLARARNEMRRQIAPTNAGLANLTNITLNAERMTNRSLDDLLKKNDLSTNDRPCYSVKQNEKGKSVTFTVPFSTTNTLRTASAFLKSKKNDKGQFKNINIVNVRQTEKNNPTLTFTLSSSKSMNIPLPPYFVQRMFGVDKPLLNMKRKITKDDVTNWSKYTKRGKNIKHVNDLIKVDNFFKEELQGKIYALWNTYGDQIARRVEDMGRVMDPKNIPKILGKNPNQDTALELLLTSAMKEYLKLEQRVYTRKTLIHVKPLYANYTNENKISDENGKHLPKFCNIPYDWRVHLVQNTMKENDQYENGNSSGNTWNKFKKEMFDEYRGNPHDLGLGKYSMKGAINNKKTNCMNVKVVNTGNGPALHYNYLLRKFRPFFRQSFHTIGSIRYPHSPTELCPLTMRDVVWAYELKSKKKNKIDGDNWIQILSERDGFDEDLKDAHVEIDNTLNQLVEYYKLKVLRELTIQKQNKSKQVDIDLAWDLYSICKNCELNSHPMFRVCAGFNAINASNPKDSKFMDRFRYMVHNMPEKHNRSEPVEGEMAHVEYVLTQSDVKFFFLSAAIYKSNAKYLVKEIVHNNEKKEAFNKHNFTKSSQGIEVLQLECDPLLSNHAIKVLEPSVSVPKNGSLLLAWPTLHDTLGYYA